MNVLGDNVAQIAREKAGIIKPGVPAFTVPQEAAADAVLRAVAHEMGTSLAICTSGGGNGGGSGDGSGDGSGGGSGSISVDTLELPRWLSPPHQATNAALAKAMMGSLVERRLVKSTPEALHAAICQTRWPARSEEILGAKATLLALFIRKPTFPVCDTRCHPPCSYTSAGSLYVFVSHSTLSPRTSHASPPKSRIDLAPSFFLPKGTRGREAPSRRCPQRAVGGSVGAFGTERISYRLHCPPLRSQRRQRLGRHA